MKCNSTSECFPAFLNTSGTNNNSKSYRWLVQKYPPTIISLHQMKIVLICGHPNFKNSIANAAIIEELKKNIPDINVRILCDLYPDYNINIQAEQSALLEADLIIWQNPYYWYHFPALMKKWLDDVFEHNFAYGSQAKLNGKKLLISFTTGAANEAYSGHPGSIGDMEKMDSCFPPIASLCHLDYQDAMFLYGLIFANSQDAEGIEKQRAAARDHAHKILSRIQEMQKS